MNSNHIDNINWKCHGCQDYGCVQCDTEVEEVTLQLQLAPREQYSEPYSVIPPFVLPPSVIDLNGKAVDARCYNGIGDKDGEFVCECGYKGTADFDKHVREHDTQNKLNKEAVDIAEHNDGTFSCECGAFGFRTVLDHLKSVHKMKEPRLELSLKQGSNSNLIELNEPRLLEHSKVFNCLCLKCSNINQVTTKMNLVVREVVIGDCQECERKEVLKQKRRLKYERAKAKKKKLAEENAMKFSGQHLPSRQFKAAELRSANYIFNKSSIDLLPKKRKEADVS